MDAEYSAGDRVQHAMRLWIARLRLRSPLTLAEEAAIAQLPGKLVEVRTNVDFVRLGEVADHACLIVEGVAARFQQTAAGARLITALHLPGDMVDLHSVVVPEASSALQALTRSFVYRVPHAAVRRLAEDLPTAAQAFWRDCVIDAMILSEWALNVGRRAALGRVAHLICELAIRYALIGHDIRYVTFPMTQQHLADMTGLTAVHVNRMLRALIDDGLIETKAGKVQILDWQGLVRAADFDPRYLHVPRERLDAILANAHARTAAPAKAV